MGIKKYQESVDLEQTIVDGMKEQLVDKDDRTLYIDGLLPRTVYSFNITARFNDGSWGPPYTLRVETSGDGMKRFKLSIF